MARGRTRAAIGLVLLWLGLVLAWLLFTTALASSEVIAGLVAAVFGTVATVVVRRQRPVRLSVPLAWLRPAWRLPGRVVSDSWLVFAALFLHLAGRRASGRFRTESFPGGGGARAVSRRVLATAGRSFPPGSYVVGFYEDKDLMLVHDFPHRAADR
jgi:hypothetical protein